jgi:Glycosyl hydrolase family 26
MMWRRRTALAAAWCIPAALSALAALILILHPPGRPRVVCPSTIPPAPYVGVAPGAPWDASLDRFRRDVYPDPGIAADYIRFGDPFPAARVCSLASDGTMLLIQLLPRGIAVKDIAAGRYDGYLTSWADAAKKTRAPVVISFGHEMNSPQFPWGFTHVSPAVFVAAWRHIHNVFTKAKAHNVIWCWNPNRPAGPSAPGPPSDPAHYWWPGNAYVNWVGIDAYYRTPTSTFASVFDAPVAEIRAFTTKPVLIAETGAAPGPREAAQIFSLFDGVQDNHLLGVVWFDISRDQHWQLEGNVAAISAFLAGANGLTGPTPSPP